MIRSLTKSLFLVLLLNASPAFAATSHPVWGPTIEPITNPAQDFRTSQQIRQNIEVTATNSGLKDRTCRRVANRFSANPSVLARLNARLMNRFGFSCSTEDLNAATASNEPAVTQPVDRPELRVAVDAFNQINDLVPRGSNRIKLLTINMTASCKKDVTVDNITLVDVGPGIASDITHLWMSINGLRLSRSRALSKYKTATLRFRRPLVIDKCETITIDFFGSVSTTALTSAKHTFSIESADDIFADADVTGSFPLDGATSTISSRNSGTLHLTYLDIEDQPRVDGSEREVLGRFRILADGTEDQTLQSIQITNDGSSDDEDFSAIYIRSTQGRARLTNANSFPYLGYVVLDFDPPFPLERGTEIDLDVVGDIVTNTGSSIKIMLDEQMDLYGVGSWYGYGPNRQLYGSRVQINGEPAEVRSR